MSDETWKRGYKHSYTDRPLTEEERQFAEDNHRHLLFYMRENHLDEEEWYDILVIPYLNAVKKYFNYEPCQKYAFSTVLNKRLFSAEWNYQRAMHRYKRMPEGGFTSLNYVAEGDNLFAEYVPNRVKDALIDTRQDVGQIVLDIEMASEILSELTGQQQTIFRLLLEGYSRTEILALLHVGRKTLTTQITSIQQSVTRYLSN